MTNICIFLGSLYWKKTAKSFQERCWKPAAGDQQNLRAKAEVLSSCSLFEWTGVKLWVYLFGENVRSLGVSQLDQSSVISEPDPNHELLIMHGLIENPHAVDSGKKKYKQKEVVVHCEGAGSQIIDGMYIYQEPGL